MSKNEKYFFSFVESYIVSSDVYFGLFLLGLMIFMKNVHDRFYMKCLK